MQAVHDRVRVATQDHRSHGDPRLVLERTDRGGLDARRDGARLVERVPADVVLDHDVAPRDDDAVEPADEQLDAVRERRALASDQDRLRLEQRFADDGETGLAQRRPRRHDVGDDLRDPEPDGGLDRAVEPDDVGARSALREVTGDEPGIGGRDASSTEVREGCQRAGLSRVAERRTTEVEREQLLRRGATVEQEVATGDADLDLPLSDVGRDVARPEVEELDAAVRVDQDEVARVGALPVARLAQHDRGRLGERALVRQADAQHGRS